MTIITPLSTADHSDWLALWNGYLTFYETTLEETVTETTFTRITSKSTVINGAIARDDTGRALGIVHWLTHAGTWTRSTLCYLEDLFIAPDARNRGVGRALIEHVREWASLNGSEKVYWVTSESNSTARALYNRVADFTGMVQYQIELAR